MGVLPRDFYDGIVNNPSPSTTTEVPLLTDYVIDLETGYLVISESGQFIICEGLRAVVMQMWRKLHTKKGEFIIYSSGYGNTFAELVGKGKSYADAYSYGKLTDCIVDGVYVKSVSDFSTSLSIDKYIMSFTAKTIYGDTKQELSIDIE